MNGKNKMMKKNNKTGFKGKNHNNKVTKNGFAHKKNFKQKFKNRSTNSTKFTYTPEDKNIPPVEVQFAKKLAANEPNIRDKAIKKLKKWLTSRFNCDNQGSNPAFDKSEMLRLWKGLHYCFWMSDKPLIQEELADKIASLMHCFKNDDDSALLYMQCFLITLGREWIGIDKHRMDKFMMLTRRMIRQCFVYSAEKKWNARLMENISNIFDVTVIGANRNSSDSSMALGFQLHVTDVYLEELAKASKSSESNSNQSLAHESIEMLIKPYVNELTWGKEERLSSQIEIRVFDHLIRQSDVAIAYEEEDDDDDQEEIDEDSLANGEIEKPDISEDEEDDEKFSLDDADPRAGKGDVVLPQLKVDFEKMAKITLEAGSSKDVGVPQRQRLYRITKKLNHVATGIYPFALEMSEDGERLIDEKEFEEQERNLRLEERKAAKRKFSEDKEHAANIREERKEYKQALKKKMKLEKERYISTIQSQKEDEIEDKPSSVKPDDETSQNIAKQSKLKNDENKIAIKDIKKPIKEKKVKNRNSLPDQKSGENADQENCTDIQKITNENTNAISKIDSTDKTKPIKESTDTVASVKKRKKKSKDALDKSSNTANESLITSSKKGQIEDCNKVNEVGLVSISKEEQVKSNDMPDAPNDITIEDKVPESGKKKKKKSKKNKSREIDSDLNDSSISSTLESLKTVDDVGSVPIFKEKEVKSNDEPDASNDITNAKVPESGKKKKKSKKNKSQEIDLDLNNSSLSSTLVSSETTSVNTFSVNNDWDDHLKDGETEIFVPNPKYSGNLKASPPTDKALAKKKKKLIKEKLSSSEVYGNPSIKTPDTPPTPVFIKKAMSKSGTTPVKSINGNVKSEPKKLSNGSLKNNKIGKANVKSKKINFAMSENKCQSLLEIDKSIQQSPNFQPYDSARKPAKGPILKTPPSRNSSNDNVTPLSKKKKQALLYNTMINSKSKFAARAVASDFF